MPIGGAIVLHMACLAAIAAFVSSVPEPPEERRLEVMISRTPASNPSLPAMESVTTPAEDSTDAAANAATPPPEPTPPPDPARVDPAQEVNAVAPPDVEQSAPLLPPPAAMRQPVRHIAPRPAPVRRQEVSVPSAPEPQHPAATMPPVAPAPDADTEARLAGRIREAVQAAVHYPPAARMMGLTGRARVLLDYRGGMVDNPTLAQSSGAPLLDTAALVAARDAHYPKPPPDLEGQRFRFLVWVEFRTS